VDNGSLSATFAGAIINRAHLFSEVGLDAGGDCCGADRDSFLTDAREVLDLVERLASEPMAVA
jgi:hypothetical protein